MDLKLISSSVLSSLMRALKRSWLFRQVSFVCFRKFFKLKGMSFTNLERWVRAPIIVEYSLSDPPIARLFYNSTKIALNVVRTVLLDYLVAAHIQWELRRCWVLFQNLNLSFNHLNLFLLADLTRLQGPRAVQSQWYRISAVEDL